MRNVLLSLMLSFAAFWAAAQEPELETTVSDQVDVAITAYNNGLALVRDTRTLRLPSGEVLLRFSDVAQQIRAKMVTLRMGSAFDVIRERIQTDYRRIASNVHESSYEIILRNHKEEDIVVDVVEPMPGDWEILRSSLEFEKVDAGSAVFHVAVPQDGETRLTYRVLVTY